jgi:predicted amidohydrolase
MIVAAVQMDVRIQQTNRNLDTIMLRMEEAARLGAKLVIFPECALTGYCYTSREEALPAAEPIPGPSTIRLAALAARLDSSAVVGMLERDGERIYNSAAVITPHGVKGAHRKMHLLCLGVDRYDTPGDRPFEVFEASEAKFGINICYDCSFPESGRVVKLLGAQLLAIPTNWPLASDTYQHTPRVRATENHLHVVAADRVGEERGFRFAGHSQIVDFEGRMLAEADQQEETVLYADLDLAAADRNRVVRIPGEYEFDRMAARRPEMYGPITGGC